MANPETLTVKAPRKTMSVFISRKNGSTHPLVRIMSSRAKHVLA